MKKYWVFKTVSEKERSYKSHKGYDDILTSKYVYDNNVANSKQVKHGDFIALVNKKNILGFAKISRIKEYKSTKVISRCPICESTNYTERKVKHPTFRCNKGHEFSELKKGIVDVIKFEAYYGESFRSAKTDLAIGVLKNHFNKGYNRNMSMQSIDRQFFLDIQSGLVDKLNKATYYINPNEGNTLSDEGIEYTIDDHDSREKIYKEIKARRGQQKFRKALLKRFNEKCCFTGCSIKHLLEAAHIKSYRGINDNHPSNGLLLRADIHTLFDLDLIGIDPGNGTIHLNKEALRDGYEDLDNKVIELANINQLSSEALTYKWKLFLKNK